MTLALIPYVGQPTRKSGKPFVPIAPRPKLDRLDLFREIKAAEMFAGGMDSVSIAAALNCTPAAAANALARARDRERSR